MEKFIKRYVLKFFSKVQDIWYIVQNDIDDVLKYKQVWKLTYGLSTSEEAMQTLIEVGEEKEEDIEQYIIEGGIDMNIETQAPVVGEQKIEQSAPNTQVLSDSP